jgi:prepilin-type N-terminal cleavage/methylation domain-containing protein
MKKISLNNTKKGFTLIELLFAMSFIAVLLLTIAVLTVHIITIYQKGLSIRSVSTTGRQLIDDFSRSIISSPIQDISVSDINNDGKIDESEEIAAMRKYYFQYFHTMELAPDASLNEPEDNIRRVPTVGAFCTGTYSYLWHTAYALQDNAVPYRVMYSYRDEGGADRSAENFKLLKISDPGREICNVDLNSSGTSNYSINSKAAPVEMLSTDESDLVLYDMQVFPASQNRITGHSFYSATFILATSRGGIDIFANGEYCSAPSHTLRTDFSYCAINKFNFAVRSTGEVRWDEGYGSRSTF